MVLSLVKSINNLTDIVNDQNKRIVAQDKRIQKLEDQINKNSSNSSNPPSTDTPYKNNIKRKRHRPSRVKREKELH